MELKEQIAGILEEAAKEAVAILLGVEIKVVGAGAPQVGPEDVVAAVNFTGTMSGRAVIIMSGRGACWITSKILTKETAEVNDEVREKLGEVLNMVAGCLKTRLQGISQDLLFQSPAAIKPEDLKTPELEKAETVNLTVAIDQAKCGIVVMYKVPGANQPSEKAAPASGADTAEAGKSSPPTEEKAAPASPGPMESPEKTTEAVVPPAQTKNAFDILKEAVAETPSSAPTPPLEKKNAFDVLKEAVAQPPAGSSVPPSGEKVQGKEEGTTRASDLLKNFIVGEKTTPASPETAGTTTRSSGADQGPVPPADGEEKKVIPPQPEKPADQTSAEGAQEEAVSSATTTPSVARGDAVPGQTEEKSAANEAAPVLPTMAGNDSMKAGDSGKEAAASKNDADIYAEAMQRLEVLLAEMKKQKDE